MILLFHKTLCFMEQTSRKGAQVIKNETAIAISFFIEQV